MYNMQMQKKLRELKNEIDKQKTSIVEDFYYKLYSMISHDMFMYVRNLEEEVSHTTEEREKEIEQILHSETPSQKPIKTEYEEKKKQLIEELSEIQTQEELSFWEIKYKKNEKEWRDKEKKIREPLMSNFNNFNYREANQLKHVIRQTMTSLRQVEPNLSEFITNFSDKTNSIINGLDSKKNDLDLNSQQVIDISTKINEIRFWQSYLESSHDLPKILDNCSKAIEKIETMGQIAESEMEASSNACCASKIVEAGGNLVGIIKRNVSIDIDVDCLNNYKTADELISISREVGNTILNFTKETGNKLDKKLNNLFGSYPNTKEILGKDNIDNFKAILLFMGQSSLSGEEVEVLGECLREIRGNITNFIENLEQNLTSEISKNNEDDLSEAAVLCNATGIIEAMNNVTPNYKAGNIFKKCLSEAVIEKNKQKLQQHYQPLASANRDMTEVFLGQNQTSNLQQHH